MRLLSIKQFSKKIGLKKQRYHQKLRIDRKYCISISQQGVPAVAAIEKDGIHLISIGDTGFLAYPWVDAMTIKEGAVSEHHALQIAQVLSKIHLINLKAPEISEATIDIYASSKILGVPTDNPFMFRTKMATWVEIYSLGTLDFIGIYSYIVGATL